MPLAFSAMTGQGFAAVTMPKDAPRDDLPAVRLVGRLRAAAAGLRSRWDAPLSPAGELAAAAAIVALGTVVAMVLYQLVDLTRLAIFFLASVVVSALLLGRRAGVFAAFFAFVAYNFSLVEPRFTFRLVGADDVLTLAVFLLVALSIGGLAGRVRESERRSRLRAAETQALLEASRSFGAAVDVGAVTTNLARRLMTIARGGAVVGLPSEVAEHAPWAAAAMERGPAGGAVSNPDEWRARRLSSGDPTPWAAWRPGRAEADPARIDRLCALMIDLASAAANRIHLADVRSGLEAEARAGRLRDAILSSISHDLRTPLSTVLTSASSLREYGDRFDLKTREDLAGVIVHEADRLNRYVERLLDLSRIEAGQVAPRLETLDLMEVVDAALRRLPGAEQAVRFDEVDTAPQVLADARLLEQAVFNLIDNAMTHGGAGAQIELRARHTHDGVTLTVEDDGPGAPDTDLALLAEKFQRGRASDKPGAGIGLAVVKGFAEAMGGRLDLARGPDGGRGFRASLTLKPAGTA